MFKDFFEINPNRIIKKVQLPNTSDHITIIDNIYLDPEKVITAVLEKMGNLKDI